MDARMKHRQVSFESPSDHWVISTLEATEAVFGKRPEIKGREPDCYFFAPDRDWAENARRWIRAPALAQRIAQGLSPTASPYTRGANELSHELLAR